MGPPKPNQASPFLRAVAHDFKEPINTIKWYFDELRKHQFVNSNLHIAKDVKFIRGEVISLATKFNNFYRAFRASTNSQRFHKDVSGPIYRKIRSIDQEWSHLFPSIDHISFIDLPYVTIFDLDEAVRRLTTRHSGLSRYLDVSDRPEMVLSKFSASANQAKADLISLANRNSIPDEYLKLNGEIEDRHDSALFAQLFQNLISNSIKYRSASRPLRIDIDFFTAFGSDLLNGFPFKPSAFESNQLFNVVVFEDNGLGIPKKFVDKIFSPYFQLKRDVFERDGGAGMGLAIVKNIAKLHKGEVFVQSEEGAGTRYTIIMDRRATFFGNFLDNRWKTIYENPIGKRGFLAL